MLCHPGCLNPSAWYLSGGIVSEIYMQLIEELNASNCCLV